MYLNGNISVSIGNKSVKTVCAVSAENNSSDIGSKCDIVLPLNCRIQYQDGKHDFLTDYPKNLFSVGDQVSIQAWYDGYPQVTVFTGYVFDFIEGMPMKVRCLDGIYLLNQTTLNLNYKTTTLKDVAEKVIAGTGISLVLPTLDLPLVNLTFRSMSPAAILEWFKKEVGLNICLLGTQLYINVASNTMDQLTLATDRNVMKSDLQKPEATYQKLKVTAHFVRTNGVKDTLEVGDSSGTNVDQWFYKVPFNITTYTKLANEALTRAKQKKFSGSVDTLLYPDSRLFMKVAYTDVRYPDKNGNYVITGVHFDIGENGYRRKLKLAYLSDT